MKKKQKQVEIYKCLGYSMLGTAILVAPLLGDLETALFVI
ncbi:hypothetical protein L63ED372_02901 [Limnohabitans sp. 63ED37-2]|nr:hypothetical protein L63ED372_02901 [Limnohabitans sp. 63ED37-2]